MWVSLSPQELKSRAYDLIIKAALNDEFCETYARGVNDIVDDLLKEEEPEKKED